MLNIRIIPCLDVKDGRVVKGVNFVNLRDAGDPAAAPRPMMPPAPTSFVFSTFPRATWQGYPARQGLDRRRALFHAADRRRRGFLARRFSRASSSPAPTRSRSIRQR
ncbi:MAG: HisA/HisF-related TIM barrel protein [Parvularculaceae bacterium]